jgi:hypothetical protein
MKRLTLVMTLLAINSFSQSLYRVFSVGYDDTLSVRSGPGAKYRKVAELSRDAREIEVIECRNRKNSPSTSWCRIASKSRKIRGWVNARYLFPDFTDPMLNRPETLHRAEKLVHEILETLGEANPCRLNRYLHPEFGLMVFIIPSGMHPRFRLIHDICRLDGEKVTEGVHQLVDPVLKKKKVPMVGRLVYGKRPVFDYDLEAWAIDHRALAGDYCYINTLDGDRTVDLVLLDSVMIESLSLEKNWKRGEYELARKLKHLRRYSYKVVCPKNNLVFFITLIDGKWYLSGFDFASMNFI